MQIEKYWLLALVIACFTYESACKKASPQKSSTPVLESRAKMLKRADSMELATNYTAPSFDTLAYYASGYAKIMCSAVFVSKLDPLFAAYNVGGFVSPFESRSLMGTPIVDTVLKTVTITLPNGERRMAKYLGDHCQGCVSLPVGSNMVFYKPQKILPLIPDGENIDWPMGEKITESISPGINQLKINQALDAAFEGAGMTAAFVVTHKGKLIAERYGESINKNTPLESWSMGKSLTATLLGILIHQGYYALDQAAPIPEWQSPGDDRAKIKIEDILHMSSGLRFRAPQDPDFDASLGYPDHLYVYTGAINSFEWAATRPQQWPPNKVGRYRNSDPVLANYLIRLAVEKKGDDYHSYPQRALFDKLGIRTMVMEADPYGNFLTQGYELASARDWARLGNLYLQKGNWNGENILDEAFIKFVSTLAEPWVQDGRPIYGGFFWINGDESRPIPKDAYMMLGAGGQSVTIIPSHDLVIVRMGHYKGAEAGTKSLNNAYKLILEAVPAKNVQ